MKTIAKAAAVAVLTAGAVIAPVSAQAIAAPLHSPVSSVSAAPLHDRGHGNFGFRHGRGPGHYRHYGDLGRHHWGRGPWRLGGYRLNSCDRFGSWDPNCYRDLDYTSAYDEDCYPGWVL
ncbi:hypothetical protein AB0C59_34135 [Streptomyces sp. NPDC048664]|uniref:hypothetical protein n=1 Tax=Streptomyces sp. NPDC048664 TaxID=3154505 RepID=UPI003418A964